MSFAFFFAIAVVALAALVRGALGFGEALVAMPLLALVLPLETAAPLVALLSILVAVVLLIRDWRHVVFRSAMLLTVSGMAAVPIGVLILQKGDDRVVKAVLAVVVIAFSTWSLRRTKAVTLETERTAPVFGFIAGLLGGAYNTSGPPLVIYATLRNWPPEKFRATLQTYFLFASVWIIVNHSLQGLVTTEILTQFAWAAPLVVGTTLVGRRLTQSIPAERFIRYAHFALLVVGVSLLVSTAVSLATAGGVD